MGGEAGKEISEVEVHGKDGGDGDLEDLFDVALGAVGGEFGFGFWGGTPDDAQWLHVGGGRAPFEQVVDCAQG